MSCGDKRPIVIIIDDDDDDEACSNKSRNTTICMSETRQPLEHNVISFLSTTASLAPLNTAQSSIKEFKDESFPPTSASLGKLSLNEAQVSNTCKCFPALQCTVRSVSKDGPNQGRLFIGCALKKCSYFRWLNKSDVTHDSSSVQWRRYDSSQGWTLIPRTGYSTEHVQQGKLGDCWFLSALAVLATRKDLLSNVVLHDRIPEDGKLCFRLFIDGIWQVISVDNYLPCTVKNSVFTLAFSGTSSSCLWVPFLEKAYAKAHGSYSAISGGEINEALSNLTGAPCEVIEFGDTNFDSELAWAKLVEYTLLGFPIGVATANTGEGVVGNHAYSLLAVTSIDDSVKLGKQRTLDDYVLVPKTEVNTSAMRESSLASSWCYLGEERSVEDSHRGDGQTRLLKIRNPWGKHEWSGDFGSGSEVWTTRLKAQLGQEARNNGVFWITWHDFLRRFERIDVCKAYVTGWTGVSIETSTVPSALEVKDRFLLHVSEPCIVYLWCIQKTKRGRSEGTGKSYWYTDLSIIITDASSRVVACRFCPPVRDTPVLELALSPGIYSVRVLHFQPTRKESFVLRMYSDYCAKLQKDESVCLINASCLLRNCLSISTQASLTCTLLSCKNLDSGDLHLDMISDIVSQVYFIRVANMTSLPVSCGITLSCNGYKLIYPMSFKAKSENASGEGSALDVSMSVSLASYHQTIIAVILPTDQVSLGKERSLKLLSFSHSDSVSSVPCLIPDSLSLFRQFAVFD